MSLLCLSRRTCAASLLSLALLGCSDAGNSGSRLPPRPIGGDFVLPASTGTLDTRELRGKVLLLFFGYVNCPDVCPASMAAGAAALNALSPAERDKVRMAMISVDPERDTTDRLKEYVAFFHPAMIGAVGTPEQTAAIAQSFGVGYVRQPTRPDGSYAVDHSALTYVVGTDGNLAEVLPLGTPTERVVAVVRGLL